MRVYHRPIQGIVCTRTTQRIPSGPVDQRWGHSHTHLKGCEWVRMGANSGNLGNASGCELAPMGATENFPLVSPQTVPWVLVFCCVQTLRRTYIHRSHHQRRRRLRRRFRGCVQRFHPFLFFELFTRRKTLFLFAFATQTSLFVCAPKP